MYNIYISNSKSPTKGEFQVDFYNNPLYFEPFTKIGVQQMYMWNSINNISASFGNNFLYIKTAAALNLWDGATNPFDNNMRETIDGINNIYKLKFEDGQYSVDALNIAIAKLTDSWNWVSNALGTAKVRIFEDESTGKIGIDLQTAGCDVLFKKDDKQATTLAYLLGYRLDIVTGDATHSSLTEYYSVAKYRSNSSKGELGPQLAQINNGVSEIHLKLTNNIVFAGYDNLSGNTDTIFSFTFSNPVGLLESFVPNNITWFNVTATNISIDRLKFKFTDQNGRDLGNNVIDNCNIVLVVDAPAKER